MRATSFKKFYDEVNKNASSSQNEIFMKPDPNKVTGMKDANYDKLNEEGYAPEGTIVLNGDVIIGKVSPIQPNNTNSKIYKDSGTIFKSNIPGTIDRVFSGLLNNDGYPILKGRIRVERIPKIGDKFSSRHGQKGTIGNLKHSADMPFTESGIVPDIIINPNAIPKRMTVGQLIETLLGKICTLQGQLGDGTPYGHIDVNDINKELIARGYQPWGNEILYNGMTGEQIEVMIFIGPMYYQRLKHMVDDKIHSRARGPTQLLTRQPTEGRARDGGLRLGEMERDALIAHGAAQFLKERLVDCSDRYEAYVCDICGTMASKMKNRNAYICTACDNNTKITKTIIPYAFKLLIQELMSMNIMPRINTDNSLNKI